MFSIAVRWDDRRDESVLNDISYSYPRNYRQNFAYFEDILMKLDMCPIYYIYYMLAKRQQNLTTITYILYRKYQPIIVSLSIDNVYNTFNALSLYMMFSAVY